MQPKLTIVVKHGKIVEVYVNDITKIDVEVHDLDVFPKLEKQFEHEPKTLLEFFTRIPHE